MGIGVCCGRMTSSRNPIWAELLQLIPIVSLALPFIVMGKVDLGHAGTGFLLGAALTIPVSAVVIARGRLLNPILVGAGLWLWLGAAAFQVPVAPLRTWIVQTQGFGLFLAMLVAGLAATLFSPYRYVACESDNPRWLMQASLAFLGLTLVVVGWSWVFRHDIRLGGGLPFIALNLARRMLMRKAPLASPAGTT